MTFTCVTCGQEISAGDYRLVGIEADTWASRYAHQGTCAEAALPRPRPRAVPLPIVEELTLDARPEPLTEELREEVAWIRFGPRRTTEPTD